MDKDHLVTAVLDRLDKKSRAKSLESIVDAAKAIKLTPPVNPWKEREPEMQDLTERSSV